MRDPAEILRQLVAIPSVSSMSNRPLVEAAGELLQESGWDSRLLPYHDANGVEKINLIAMPGGQDPIGGAVDLAFVCHTDTVPFIRDVWPQATALEARDGFLYGCGACDVKGSLAGILAAIARVGRQGVEHRVALCLTADEEIGCIGASRLVDANVLRTQSAIVCEPTSLRPATAGKGYGLARIRVRGKEAHSAFPEQGASAIYAAARLIRAIEERALTHSVARHTLFDPPYTTMNIGIIEGGTAKNIIAGECRFLVEWRSLPNEDPRAPQRWLSELAAEMETSLRDCRVEVEPLRADAGFEADPGSAFVTSLSKQLGNPPTGISFGSEATRFARIADEVVVLGPGDMNTAHSDRERISVRELELWTECVAAQLSPRG